MRPKEELRGKRDHPNWSKGRISVIDQERHMALDLIFQVWNTSEKRSVKMCGTLKDRSLNRSHPLAMGQMKIIDLTKRVCDLGFGRRGYICC
jgi:hypothetical protein